MSDYLLIFQTKQSFFSRLKCRLDLSSCLRKQTYATGITNIRFSVGPALNWSRFRQKMGPQLSYGSQLSYKEA